MASTHRERAAASERAVVTKAVLRAAKRLGLSNKALGGIIGVSEATVSRMGSASYTLSPREKKLDTALGATPLALVQSVSGLVYVLGYLDARRALA